MAVFDIPREAVEQVYLPTKPIAAHTKDGAAFHVTKNVALDQFAYIQPNPPCLRSLIITDRDLSDTDYITDELGLLVPSWTACNPTSGTGHVAYALSRPVCTTNAARRKPVNLLARIEAGLVTVLGGDPAYNGVRTKNPLDDTHLTVRLWTDEIPTYSLHDLAQALDDLHALPHWNNRKAITGTEIGRNVALFDATRRWSYTAIRKHSYPPINDWFNLVEGYATTRNLSDIADTYARGPLPPIEVHHISRSIAKWTHKRFTKQAFSDRQRDLAFIGAQQRLHGLAKETIAEGIVK